VDSVRLIWSLANSGLGSTIAGSGNSGGWSSANVNAETLLDLRWTNDLAIMVSAASIVSSPTLTVALDGYDDQGNPFPGLVKVTALTGAASAGAQIAAGGSHAPTAGTYIVFPAWGRISWTCSGGSTTGTEIAVYAR
jgi:hypothetical protein